MAEASRAGVFASTNPLIAVEIWKAAGLFPDRSDGYRALLLVQLSGPLDEAGWHAAAEIVGAALVADEDAKAVESDDRPLTLRLRTEIDVATAMVRMGGVDVGVVEFDALAPAATADPEPLGGGILPEPEAAPVPEVELVATGIPADVTIAAPSDAELSPGQAEDEAAAADEGEEGDGWWTPARDLLLVEALASGKKIVNAALTLDRPREDCLARYRALLPKVTLVEQQSLIKRLRAEAAEG